ncbi:hypothetical protein OUZ56_029330 [Daphnia magna]|uniref:Uncharacterized protein n=1 Tax=Daphnia magna TaxID=35525 RepID=A0ABR0B6I9_9CRUS|nr:hypothetical protein OUZ56_029330 [Daphnia magna]
MTTSKTKHLEQVGKNCFSFLPTTGFSFHHVEFNLTDISSTAGATLSLSEPQEREDFDCSITQRDSVATKIMIGIVYCYIKVCWRQCCHNMLQNSPCNNFPSTFFNVTLQFFYTKRNTDGK